MKPKQFQRQRAVQVPLGKLFGVEEHLLELIDAIHINDFGSGTSWSGGGCCQPPNALEADLIAA